MIQVLPIASGSAGNCILLVLDGTKIMIDLGITAASLKKALSANQFSTDEIAAVLITHTHSDHIKGLDVCMRRIHAPLFMSSSSKTTLQRDDAIALNYYIRTEIIHRIWVTAFPTSHDCPGSVGYLIETDSLRIGYATDLGIITDDIMNLLAGADCIVIESNHDEEMLRFGRYPFFLKQRILSDHGHLSNEACAKAVAWFARRGTRHFLLAHLSQENNLPESALISAKRATSGMDVTIDVLPVRGTKLIEL